MGADLGGCKLKQDTTVLPVRWWPVQSNEKPKNKRDQGRNEQLDNLY